MKYRVVVIRPQGYEHSSGLQEVAETLMYGFRHLGFDSDMTENRLSISSQNIILGAHLLTGREQLPKGTILYNLEQLTPYALRIAGSLSSTCKVWDYSARNVEEWKKRGVRAKHVPLGYVPELTRIKPAEKQDIDVLFYGSLNERRAKILAELTAAGLKVERLFGIYGEERDSYIARAKVVLNMHYYESKIFEIVRVAYLLANSKCVVSEESVDDDSRLDGAYLIGQYEFLLDLCRLALDDGAQQRSRIEPQALKIFSQYPESDILRAAIAESVAA